MSHFRRQSLFTQLPQSNPKGLQIPIHAQLFRGVNYPLMTMPPLSHANIYMLDLGRHYRFHPAGCAGNKSEGNGKPCF